LARVLGRANARTALGVRSAGVLIEQVLYIRKRYGEEAWVTDDHEVEWPEQCPDCGARRGEFHYPNCGIEACPRCGLPLDGCNCTAAAST